MRWLLVFDFNIYIVRTKEGRGAGGEWGGGVRVENSKLLIYFQCSRILSAGTL
jgi:hypothetical protein